MNYYNLLHKHSIIQAAHGCYTKVRLHARVAELVDARDLKSLGQKPCGFDSRLAHQIGTKTETVARTGGFFAGSAQRRPAIFLEGVKKLVVIYDDFFLSYL